MTDRSGHDIVVATGNPGKVREIARVLEGSGVRAQLAPDLNMSAVEETGLTFVENALLKARYACAMTGRPALADDSGLEVDALEGAPGVHSARFAGSTASDADNNRKLLAALNGVAAAQRSARFRCVLVLLRHGRDPAPLICQGTWEGHIATASAGANGFGYDPLFVPAGMACTSAELAPDQKNRVSHRGQALAALLTSIASFLPRQG